jgi:quercetin dioxygenase-like cupin family protein
MKLPIVDEMSISALDLPGRQLRWLMTEEITGARHCSMCMILVAPGETVRPAHSHPHGEEIIYIVHGTGKVMIEGVVEPVKPGSAILFPQGQVHMLRNTGTEEMKVVCFFAPSTNLDNYKLFYDVQFPE